ncbi:hypothetical protein LINGRAHAP2_LOCUS13505 [Linum grandiflorum]
MAMNMVAATWTGSLIAVLNNNKFTTSTKPKSFLASPPRAAAASLGLSRRESIAWQRRRIRVMATPKAEATGTATTTIEKSGIKIVRNPPESKLSDLGVRSWPKWGCPPSKFPWTYSSRETCYLLQGKVKVYPEGSDEGVEIAAGDLVEFPNGMSCTWDVSVAVDKHYKFD